jgi:hypothetical protein
MLNYTQKSILTLWCITSGLPVIWYDAQNAEQPFNGLMQPSFNFQCPARHTGSLIPVPKVNKAKEQMCFQVFSSSFEVFTFLESFMVLISSLFPAFWGNILGPNISNKLLTSTVQHLRTLKTSTAL